MLDRSLAAAVVIMTVAASGLEAQIPPDLEATLLFKLGGMDAGSETFHVEQLPEGGYLLRTDVDLQVPNLHIVQNIEARAGTRRDSCSSMLRYWQS